MIIKIVGMVIILTSSALLGFGFAECMSSRARELMNIADALEIMISELSYGHFAISDIFFKVKSFVKGEASLMFEEICKNLERGDNASCAWSKAIDVHAKEMSLKIEDANAIKNSAYLLEAMELDEQKKFLLLLKERIMSLADEAAASGQKNSKIVKMLGIYGGILLCIIVF